MKYRLFENGDNPKSFIAINERKILNLVVGIEHLRLWFVGSSGIFEIIKNDLRID